MRVLIDVDGVVADLLGHLWARMDTLIRIEDLKSWHIISDLPEHESKQILHWFHDMEFWRTLPVMDGAREGVQYLRESGYDVAWVTAPYPSCKGWADARYEWLQKNMNASYKDICLMPRKGLSQGDIFIDDKPENVREWQQANPKGKAFLYSHPFNQYEALPRFTWGTMLSDLKSVM